MTSDDAGPAPTKNTLRPDPSEERVSPVLPEDEERSLLSQSDELKAAANTAFASGDYPAALDGYSRALDICPTYLDYHLAVLQSNMAACCLKMEEWKKAAERATEAVDGLQRIDPLAKPVQQSDDKAAEGSKAGASKGQDEGEAVIEVDDAMEERLEALKRTGKTVDDVRKLRTKAMLRRAKARSEIGTWAELHGAMEDYTFLSRASTLTPTDSKTVQAAMRTLPGRLEASKQQEMAEMMGKLKSLGNGILKPFGLSTDNFQFTKDEQSGGYSMQFKR